MGWYLEGAGQGVQISNLGWIDVLILAQRFGWDGRGVEDRVHEDRRDDGDCQASTDQLDAEDDATQCSSFISAENAASFADALEMAFAILKVRNPSIIEAIAARTRVRAATYTLDPDYASISTEDLMDMFGHQKQLLESIIAVARTGKVSIW